MINSLDANFIELVRAIENYCMALLGLTHLDGVAASALICVFARVLPELEKRLNDGLPALIYAEKIITFAAEGLGDEYYLALFLWKEYYLGGVSIDELARHSNYSSKTVKRRAVAFPGRVATQLWKKNREFVDAPASCSLEPKTLDQQRQEIVQAKFHLTAREAEVILAYAQPGANRGRRAIAKSLFIGINTLKTHHRSICRKMSAQTINEAVKQVREILPPDQTNDQR